MKNTGSGHKEKPYACPTRLHLILHQGKSFVERLEQRLQQEGIDTWRDEKAAVAGRLESQINDAIFEKAALVLVFSQHSCGSNRVEWVGGFSGAGG